MQYNSEDLLVDEHVKDPHDLSPSDDESIITWLDVQGVGDAKVIQDIAAMFEIPPLALEDMVNSPQRPKILNYGDKLLIITRMVQIRDDVVDREQVALLIGKGVVISFQERYGDVLGPIRARLSASESQFRKKGADYLAYAIWDTIVDAYYPLVELLTNQTEDLEEQIMANPGNDILSSLSQKSLLVSTLYRSLRAQSMSLHMFLGTPTDHIQTDNLPYFSDILDHTQQLEDGLENLKDYLTTLLQTSLSLIGYRSNEIMKVLTIMAAIFIPLTFLAGIYGMNFDYMPETKFAWGYPVALSVMAFVGLGMVFFFYRKGWIGNRTSPTTRSKDDLSS